MYIHVIFAAALAPLDACRRGKRFAPWNVTHGGISGHPGGGTMPLPRMKKMANDCRCLKKQRLCNIRVCLRHLGPSRRRRRRISCVLYGVVWCGMVWCCMVWYCACYMIL